jgi:hypothetical protein
MIKKLSKLLLLALFLAAGMTAWSGGGQEPTEGESKVITGVPETKYNESPTLAEKVASGALPNVDERLPDQPYIMEIIDEVGKYGGELNVLWNNPNNGDMYAKMWWDGLYEFPLDGVGLAP